MRYKLLAALVFISCGLQAQQVNPVPDYVFANRMSVGRSAVTDTLAYFSIGPRYGAIRGFMPPMVVDTALVTGGTKRNGLTIFSIQKNKYVYWDSVGSKWAEMAGIGGTAINSGDTASMLSPYIRAAGYGLTKSGQSLLVDTSAMATRARVQKAVDSINTNVTARVKYTDTSSMLSPYTLGSGTTNYLPKFTASRTLGNSIVLESGGNEIYVNNTDDKGAFTLQVGGWIWAQNYRAVRESGVGFEAALNTAAAQQIRMRMLNTDGYLETARQSGTPPNLIFGTEGVERARITADGELLINGTTDQGAFALQVTGAIYNTTTLTTGAPTSGTAKPWRLGEAATVSPTSPNRTIRVEIDGTVYYLHAKTTND